MSAMRQLVLDKAARADEARRDTLVALAWVTGSASLGIVFASGHPLDNVADALTTAGRVAGTVAATLIMVQLILIARVPWVERLVGHDKATKLHGLLGKIAFISLVLHAFMLILGYGMRVNVGPTEQSWAFLTNYGPEMTFAVAALALFAVVVGTSLAAVRAKWPYERWHNVHLLTYVAVLVAIPHQIELGSSFSHASIAPIEPFARAYWAVLWFTTIALFVTFRLIAPAMRAYRDGLEVVSVTPAARGMMTVEIAGPGVERIKARGGQFMLWRFLSPGMWRNAHPYSLSASPKRGVLRISVKAVGESSAALADLLPGTKVIAEGPLGRFSLDHQRATSLVLVAAGSGISPILGLLHEADEADAITVIIRARSEDEIPHLDELRAECAAKGAVLHLMIGSRGLGWQSAGSSHSLADLAPHLLESDIYVCGPALWSQAVLDDAVLAGVRRDHLHVEEFAL